MSYFNLCILLWGCIVNEIYGDVFWRLQRVLISFPELNDWKSSRKAQSVWFPADFPCKKQWPIAVSYPEWIVAILI